MLEVRQAWAIRIAVNDLETKCDERGRRDTRFERRCHPRDGAMLLVDTGPLDVPGLFEFAQI